MTRKSVTTNTVTCDRCGATAEVEGKKERPDAWGYNITRGKHRDLCPSCFLGLESFMGMDTPVYAAFQQSVLERLRKVHRDTQSYDQREGLSQAISIVLSDAGKEPESVKVANTPLSDLIDQLSRDKEAAVGKASDRGRSLQSASYNAGKSDAYGKVILLLGKLRLEQSRGG